MNKLYILFGLFLFAFISCSKQTTAVVVEEPVVENPNAWRSATPAPGPARKINLGEYTLDKLDNGLKIIVVENHKLPRVSYQLSLDNLPVLEKDQAGYVNIAGSLLSTGTKSKTKADIDEAVDYIGASLNTSSAGVFGSSLSKHQHKLLGIMSDVLMNPTFPEDQFERIKKQTISGIQSERSDPNAMAANVAAVLRNGKDHPYGEIETEKSIGNISLDKCVSYYNTFFKPNNATLTIVGDITPAKAKKLAMQYFGDWSNGTIPALSYDTPEKPDGTKVAFVNKDGAVQSTIRVTYPVNLKPGSQDAIAASVMNSILGGGMFSGRLMQNLREDKAYTYGARSNLGADRLVGSFNAFASVRNEVTDSSVQEFIYEMKRMSMEDVTEADLQLVKNSMTGSFARSLESPQTIARFARNIVRFNLPSDYYETYLEKLNAVSVADVRRLAAKYITPENAYVVVVGSKDDVAEKLARFDSDGVIDYYDPFGNLLKASENEIPEGITSETIINDFLDAMGGKEKLKSLKSLEQTYNVELMGQPATITMYQKAPNKYAMAVNAMGMVVQEQRFDGVKGLSAGMGKKDVITEGKELQQLAKQANMVPQLNYANGYTTELKGIEDLDGVKCYKIAVVDPDGEKSTEYYSLDKNLLMRTIVTMDMGGENATITNDVADYKEVDGVLLPHKITTSGMMPVPMVMEASSIKVNQEISDDKFVVE